MKKRLIHITALFLAAAPSTSSAATFFTDDFSHGSSLNGNSIPGGTPAASFTSYDIASTKNATACTIAPNDLTMKLNAATTSGFVEAQALFTNNAIALSTIGDYIDISVVFTNTGGTLLAAGSGSLLWIGLFDSGGSAPAAGGLANAGLTTTAGSPFAAGNCANWQGYAAQISGGGTTRTYTRPLQNGANTTSANQELLGNNVGGGAFNNPGATVLATAPVTNITLTAGGQYTLFLRLTLSGANNLTISNSLFVGAGTGGTIVFTQQTNNITNATFLTASFDGLCVGTRSSGTSLNPTMDIASIVITGQSTPVTTPPVIVVQPAPVSVASGGSCAFTVSATGFGLEYQWHRYGTNLANGGNISGATSDTLIVSSAGPADVASGLNGYYITITGTGGYSTNSVTNSLSLRTAANLTWSGSGNVWDLAVTSDWDNGGNPSVFNFGDSVTFDDMGSGNLVVSLAGPFLSPSSVTVNSAFDYVFGGTGNLAGPGTLLYKGSGHLTMNSANSYSGGTTISNANAFLVLNNYNALGTGPLTLAAGQMEIVPPGSAALGINGDVAVADDFTITYDGNSPAFGAVFLGNLSGASGKTLTFVRNSTNTLPSRVRVYGVNTVYDGNLNLSDARVVWAAYQPNGSQTYNGVISGPGGLVQRGNGTTILNGQNTYSGGTTPTAGALGLGIDTSGGIDFGPIGTGPLLLAPEPPNLTGSGNVFASGGARTIANPIQYQSGTNNYTLQVSGSNAMTFSGPVTLNGNDGLGSPTNRFFQIANTALTTLSGVISDSGLGYGLVKTGNGTLALSSTETYTGPTLITNGTLQVNGQLGSGSVTVATNAMLSGTGTVNGPVTALAGGILAPGHSIGTLTVNNNVSFAGNLGIEVNKSLSPASDNIVVSGTLINSGAGTVSVTNLGPALAQGDTFALFNKPVVNGVSLTVTGANVIWTNKLAVDGTIAVASVIATNPTNITFSVSGNTLTLSWPADHTGWLLQAQTNAINVGIGTNWNVVSGSGSANQYITTINRANGSVFYRLISP
jgi:autotransporter-associated beta strand protein